MTTPSLTRPMDLSDWGLMLALSLLWGGSFLFIKIAVVDMPPLVLVLGRVALAALTLVLTLPMFGQTLPRSVCAWRAFFGMGLLNNVIPFSLIFWGQQSVTAGVAAILNASTPFFAVLAAHFLTAEKATAEKIAGIAIGFSGVALLIGPDVLWRNENPWPMLAFLGAALSYGLSGIFGRRFQAMTITPLQAACGQLCASTIMMLPAVLFFHGAFWQDPYSMRSLTALGLLAVFSTALAYLIFFRILATAGPTNLSLVTMLIPVSAVLLGAVFLNENLLGRHAIGMGVIALGLLVIDGRIWRTLRGGG